eukprot:g4167.t1
MGLTKAQLSKASAKAADRRPGLGQSRSSPSLLTEGNVAKHAKATGTKARRRAPSEVSGAQSLASEALPKVQQDVLDVEVVKTNLGVESFSSDIRSSVCEQSFCRGQIARMAQIFQRCPGEAGVKGERARLARMLLRTVHSCTRAGGAVLNVQDSFVLKGVNVLNPGEHDGLAAAVQEALAAQMPWPRGLHVWFGRLARSLLDWPVNVVAWLGGVPAAAAAKSARSMVTVNVRPRYPSADVWSRTAGWSDSTAPAGQEAVAFVPEHLPGGACQGCSVRNLQVLAVHPAIGAEGVDPAGAGKRKLTVAEMLALKGQRQLVLTTAFDEWTARAAEEAGVDMIVAWGSCQEHSKFVVEAVRRGAPNTLIGTGINPGAYDTRPNAPARLMFEESQEKALKLANEMRAAGTDIIYCSGLVPEKFAGLARQHVPCCGHVGYLPVNNTWYGGPRGVGKTAEEAKKAAGCIAVEMECVPAKVAEEITKRTKLLQFCLDVQSGAYPQARHCIKINDQEFARFQQSLASSPTRLDRALEKVCEEAEVNPFVYYPWDTGTGEVQVATQNRHATRTGRPKRRTERLGRERFVPVAVTFADAVHKGAACLREIAPAEGICLNAACHGYN